MHEVKYPREFLLNICTEFKEFAMPTNNPHEYIQSMAIAGSLRRGEAECGDIELIIVPEFLDEVDLFGGNSRISKLPALDLSLFGVIEKAGDKYIKLLRKTPAGYVQLDIFIVNNIEAYGLIMMLRTGPAEFSKKMVTSKAWGGMLPKEYTIADGFIWSDDKIIPVKTEKELFNLYGIDYIEPKNRR